MGQKRRSNQKRRRQRNRRRNDDNDFEGEDINLSYPGLPSEIILYDILTRVPTKSLMQFKSVCKHWSKILIKDPLFIELYSRRNYNAPGFIFSPRSSRLVFFDINNKRSRNVRSPAENDGLGNCDDIEILYSLNGLLLLSCRDKITETYYHCVFNPMTRQFKNLPEFVLFFDDSIYSHEVNEFHYCLAYDSTISKYKVVCFVESTKYRKERSMGNYFCECFCKILTLGHVEGDNTSWRDVVVPKPHNFYLLLVEDIKPPVFANGYVHCMILMKQGETENKHKILSLDVSKETFNTIRVPECTGYERINLVEMGGLLCFAGYVEHRLKLWVLEQVEEESDNHNHNKKHEWLEKCSIDLGQSSLTILAHPDSTKLIFWSSCGYESTGYLFTYYSYDMELKQLDFIFDQMHNRCWFHVNSLTYF